MQLFAGSVNTPADIINQHGNLTEHNPTVRPLHNIQTLWSLFSVPGINSVLRATFTCP